ncbi:MAG: nucleotidyl transferase AbiEii/AbiGii toxin family protein [Bacillota bacterium]
MNVIEALKSIKKIFTDNKIPYCLIGGFAVSIYGKPRFSEDIDFLVIYDDEGKRKLIDYLTGNNIEHNYRSSDLFEPIGDLLELKLSGIIVQTIRGRYKWEKEILDNSVEYELEPQLSIKVVKPEDLLILKLKAGGTLDLIDVNNIYQVQKDSLNIEYLVGRIEQLNLKLIAQTTMLSEILT